MLQSLPFLIWKNYHMAQALKSETPEFQPHLHIFGHNALWISVYPFENWRYFPVSMSGLNEKM